MRDDIFSSRLARLVTHIGAEWRAHGIGNLGFSARSASGLTLTRHYRSDTQELAAGAAHPLFRLGSLSKMLATATVLVAAERGLMDIAAPLGRSFPELRLPVFSPLKTATLADLLSHRSSLGRVETASLKHRDGTYRLPITAMTEERLLAAIEQGPLNTAGHGRAVFDYSDFGMALAGLAVERATGERYASFAARAVLRAHSVEGVYPTVGTAIPAFAQRMLPGHTAPERTIPPLPPRPIGLHALDPALGAVAAVEGLTQFTHLFLSGGVVSRRMTDRMSAARTPFGERTQANAFGLGVARFSVGDPAKRDFCLGHLCIFEGFCGFSGFHPATGVTLSVLMNSVISKPSIHDGSRREPNPGGFVRALFAGLAAFDGEALPWPHSQPPLWRRLTR